MRSRFRRFVATLALVCAGGSATATRAAVDNGAIRLETPAPAEAPATLSRTKVDDRRAFDYEAFGARLEGLWFQRKALQAEGRPDEAARYSDLIRSFCAEEGVQRLPHIAGALIVESHRFLREGSYARAIESLNLAELLDPGNAQVHLARAQVLWKSRGGMAAAALELARALVAVTLATWGSFQLLSHVGLALVVALVGCIGIFSLLMVGRYQMPFRHEVEEWLTARRLAPWAVAAGWLALTLPLLSWIGAGWSPLYWIAVTYRFMRRTERVTAIAVLAVACVIAPLFRASVGGFGLSTDPTVRTVSAAAAGEYEPDKIVQLQKMVDAYPDEPNYRFLLAGLYKSGRYFEEAYEQYRAAAALAPGNHLAVINMGNIFFHTGQYAEAIAQYRKALEIRPDSVLAYYNMYLAQSETFRFQEAEESLRMARQIDSSAVAQMFSRRGKEGERSVVIDASLGARSVWQATLEDRPLLDWLDGSGSTGPTAILNNLASPLSVASALALLSCVVLGLGSARPDSRRCIRCGRTFCGRCRVTETGSEYCSQCVHLFVLKDGLAVETKTRKLYEVERHERIRRWTRSLASLVLPGASQILRGRTLRGTFLIVLWLSALVVCWPVVLEPLERFLGTDLQLHALRPSAVPTAFAMNPLLVTGLPLLLCAWILGNAWRWRERRS